LLVPLFGISQTKNVVNSFRVFAKPEKTAEFEKALAAHAQKYHTGDWKWRVFAIQSGPDANGYQVTEGPNSWETIDGRRDISPEHTADWEKNVLPLSTGMGTSTYAAYNADMSTVQLTDYTDKIVLNHMFPKPGMIVGLTELVKKFKKVWEAGNETVAVYSAIASGPPQFITSTRLKAGLKELDESYRKPMSERYNAVYGAGTWDSYLADYAKYIETRWSELLFYRADLSSK
jgi:hypothetical protein